MLKKAVILVITAVILTSASGCDKTIKITTGMKEDVIFKLSDSECSLSEIVLMLVNEKNRYEKDFGEEIWNKKVDGKSMEDNVKASVKDKQVYLEAIYMLSLKKSVELTDEEEAALKASANEYFATLSKEETELMNVTEKDVFSLYKKSCLAEKVYKQIADNVNAEVSDEEARVMSAMYIYVRGNDEQAFLKVNEAYEKVKAGADFYFVATEYSDDELIQTEFARGQMIEEVEEQAFELEADEYTQIIKAESGYYILKCVDDYLEDKTQSNKEKMMSDIINEEFLKEFEPFLREQKLDFNDSVWKDISLENYTKADTDSLFEVYEKHMDLNVKN